MTIYIVTHTEREFPTKYDTGSSEVPLTKALPKLVAETRAIGLLSFFSAPRVSQSKLIMPEMSILNRCNARIHM